ncbi:[Histone H3]-lysine-36 demethylase [Rhodotorula paludigena]|uniref:[Histone H3]-lysine-36 demethylase n=1 Tax=Rhodotorula paludigena TaxID=86838 RepID=UPI00317620EC
MAASTPSTGRTTSASRRAAAPSSSPASAQSLARPRRAAYDKSPFAPQASAGHPASKPKPSPAKGTARDQPATKGKKSAAQNKSDGGHDDGDEHGADSDSLSELSDSPSDHDEPGEAPSKDVEPAAAASNGDEQRENGHADATKAVEEPQEPAQSSNATLSASTPKDSVVTAPEPPVVPAAPLPSASTSTSTTSSSLAAPRPPASNLRKSSRTTRAQNIDYANLDQHLPASVDRWIKTIDAREHSGQIVDAFRAASDGGGGFRMFRDGRELAKEGDEWVYGEQGMMEPFVVEHEDGLGLQMPPRSITVKEVAELVGPKTPLEVIDCASQSSLSNWTLGQWAKYYDDPKRDKVRNVISLEVSESRLGAMVQAPELVRKLDWVDNVWPNDMKVPGQYPRVQKYCLMSVEKCWTDWHVDFAGSSVFYHVLRGGKTFFFIRPTPANLQAYEQWSGSSERQEQEWLGDAVDKVYRMDLKEGYTAFIPTGWIHAVYTPADSLVIGGNFLHSLNIPTQLRVYQIELATKVPRKFRYPHFVKLLWLVGRHYHHLLTSHPADQPLPLSLSARRVLDGLKELSSFLIEQTTRFAKGANVSAERRRIARENIPWNKIPDPVTLSRDFRKAVLKARGEEADAECFLPHVAYVDEPADLFAGTKRKADSLEPDAHAALAAANKAKMRRPSAAPAAAAAFPAFSSGGADGEIIGRQTFPVQTTSRTEERIDPRGSAKLGALVADVRESRSTQSVVRRWDVDPLDASGRGGPVVETRTVITIVERVKFPSAAAAAQQHKRGYQSYAPYDMTRQPAYPPPGIGPHAPQSVTAVPGTPAPPVTATNAAPYNPYGWPFQYSLPPPGHQQQPLPPLPQPQQYQQGQQPPSQSQSQQQQQPLPQPQQPPGGWAIPGPSGSNAQSAYAPSLPPTSSFPALPTPPPPGVSPNSAAMPPPPLPRPPQQSAYAPQQQQQQSPYAPQPGAGGAAGAAMDYKPCPPALPPAPAQQQQQQQAGPSGAMYPLPAYGSAAGAGGASVGAGAAGLGSYPLPLPPQ